MWVCDLTGFDRDCDCDERDGNDGIVIVDVIAIVIIWKVIVIAMNVSAGL